MIETKEIMKQLIFFILIFFTLIQCQLLTSDVTYSRELINAHITDFELVGPVHFGNEFYRVSGAKFRVTGESGIIYDVRFKVYGTVKFCSDNGQDEIDIVSDIVLIADTLHISSKTVHIGTGIDYLTVPIDEQALRSGQQQYAGTVGVSIYYTNDDGNSQVSKSESYEYFDLYCQ